MPTPHPPHPAPTPTRTSEHAGVRTIPQRLLWGALVSENGSPKNFTYDSIPPDDAAEELAFMFMPEVPAAGPPGLATLLACANVRLVVCIGGMAVLMATLLLARMPARSARLGLCTPKGGPAKGRRLDFSSC